MSDAFVYTIWILSFALEVYIVVRSLVHKDFRRYLSLNVFVGAMAARDVAAFFVQMRYGFTSLQYTYTYYYTDALLTILMYLTIAYLYFEVFREMHFGRYVRGVTLLLLAGTALFSYAVVQSNTDHLTGRFVVEMSQNMYFVGLVLTYLLWVAVFKLRETRARLVQLILALGIYFSATAATFAFRNMFPSMHSMAEFMGPLIGALLPMAWAYTFTKVPENARLVPQTLAGVVSHR
ncbi:MAG: hypothetical protein KGL59_15065 [Acidobacteriota bacterium]|nr:hypothetical protein [Acidobacteriota bacterium]